MYDNSVVLYQRTIRCHTLLTNHKSRHTVLLTNHKSRWLRRRSRPYKMVLVIRSDLDMTAGKIAAQCCHATLGRAPRSRLL